MMIVDPKTIMNMNPVNYGGIFHRMPILSFADDGFGNLVFVEDFGTFTFNVETIIANPQEH